MNRKRLQIWLACIAVVGLIAFVSVYTWRSRIRPMFHNIYRPPGDRGGGWTPDWPLIDARGRWVLLDDQLNIIVLLMPTAQDEVSSSTIKLHRKIDYGEKRTSIEGYPRAVEITSDMADRVIVVRSDGSMVWMTVSRETLERLASALRGARADVDYTTVVDAVLEDEQELRSFIQAELK